MVSMRVRFGDFLLDRGTRQLLRGEEPRRLGPKAFALLELLIQHRPNVIGRERIHDCLWPGISVTESTLATVVAEVRSALDDDPKEPVFLRTVHGVGYAFCGSATESDPQPKGSASPIAYRLVLDGREVALHAGENILGRKDEGVAWIESPSVSRRHARIVIGDGPPMLEDLGSKNGTFLNGQRLSAPAPLSDGDVFRLGRVSLRLRILGRDQETQTDG
jgi:DNA-binding winged helix-turn-helix (wHTH) protein